MQNNQDESVKVDEIANLLARVKPVEVYAHEESLATILIQKALENAQVTSTAPGISLAAAFDLIVAAEYYGKLTNKG
ncbi:hypothetical protein PN497_14855 [Sphaerospermopsis kisseleviana CS-549]|uniref:Uncharacterized protein n=1 Tax=Sphaerospermopsis kisseleviana CS-549 TaxID=3021783 RepID=A0ABT4ZT75_9CYAN|nr:hypothetical protein [Sphaerospermopsis kisseleviana]MDB9442633.1 hypothetical protein [Sphaerospermopsis kisseleviana CS-549]BAZ82036.1 hypothetical protein NIES73_33060 [Sphaerospermopsis kisseleviana NIES-73]